MCALVAVCKDRNAVVLPHVPEGTHSLAPRSGSLARLTFHDWSAWQESHLQPSRLERDASANWATRGRLTEHKLGAKLGAHGRICTDTVRVLSAPSLHWTTWAKLVPREGFPPPTSPS